MNNEQKEIERLKERSELLMEKMNEPHFPINGCAICHPMVYEYSVPSLCNFHLIDWSKDHVQFEKKYMIP